MQSSVVACHCQRAMLGALGPQSDMRVPAVCPLLILLTVFPTNPANKPLPLSHHLHTLMRIHLFLRIPQNGSYPNFPTKSALTTAVEPSWSFWAESPCCVCV